MDVVPHAPRWPLVPSTLVGATFAASAGHVEAAVAVALLASYFSVTSFFRFRSGLGRRSTSPAGWFGSLGCLLALGAGASFFVLLGYDGFPEASITSRDLNDDGGPYRLMLMLLCPAAAGVFTYYFVELTLRIRHPRGFLTIYAIGFFALLVSAVGSVAAGWAYGLAGLRLAGIICFATGGLISVSLLNVIAVRMVFRRLVFDVALTSTLVLGFYAVSATSVNEHLLKGEGSIASVAMAQTAVLIVVSITLTLMGGALAFVRKAISKQI